MSSLPQQQYAHNIAQDSSRQHNGNVYIEQQNNYNHPDIPDVPNIAARDISLRDALAFPRMDFRSDTIATAYPNTCQWLFETPEYKRWLDPAMRRRHLGLLWIKGNPGAGKSTIMKCAVRHAGDPQRDHRVLSFFFNARGGALEKSTEGMYRALLHQVAKELPPLRDPIPPAKLRQFNKDGWPIELLKDLFRIAVRHFGRTEPFICYVDALDEGAEHDVRGMVQFFQELGKTASTESLQFMVCFASRHYPRISVRTCEELVLDRQKGHEDDITGYIRQNLNVMEPSLMEDMATEIREKSQGVFLWVVLVIDMLNTACDHGRNHRLRDQLHAVPIDLRALLDGIVTRSEQDKRLAATVQWVLFSPEPLDDEQIYFAVMTSIGELTDAQRAWDEGIVTEDTIKNFILDSAKGLIEVRHGRAQFIHESVREYFLQCGLQKLDPDVGEDVEAASDEKLASWCLAYLKNVPVDASLFVDEKPQQESKKLRQAIRKFPVLSYPFTNHAILGSLFHAEAASKGGCRQDTFLAEFPVEHWILLMWMWDAYYEERPSWKLHPLGATLLHLLTIGKQHCLLRNELERYALRPSHEREAYINADCTLGLSLEVAVEQSDEVTVQLLLNHGADPNGSSRQLKRVVRPGEGSALHQATWNEKDDIIQLLLQHGSGVNAEPTPYTAESVDAVRRGREEIDDVLLEQEADTNAENSFLLPVLRMAMRDGHKGIFKLLLEHGADANTQVEVNFSSWYNVSTFDLSIERDVDPKTSDHYLIPILSLAVAGKDPCDFTRLLLEHGADAYRPMRGFENALQLANYLGDESVVQILQVHLTKLSLRHRMEEPRSQGRWFSGAHVARRMRSMFN